MSKYTENDAAKDTDVSKKEVASTWHQAREDARESGEISSKDYGKSDDNGGTSGK